MDTLSYKKLMKLPLYHGSREGISGTIKPMSREKCDFGKGFYMGTEQIQTIGLIAGSKKPTTYTLEMDYSKIPEEKILFLNDRDWLNAVIGFRTNSEVLKESRDIKSIIEKIHNADLIVGRIADDKMRPAIKYFEKNLITDKVLLECLRKIDYGYQIVAKSQIACDAISILNERRLTDDELHAGEAFTKSQRQKAENTIEEMNERYGNQGKLLRQIIRESRFEIYDDPSKNIKEVASWNKTTDHPTL